MTVLRLNHGLSQIPQIPRILRSPERLSRNRGCFGFKRTAFGHGDPNEHRARGPERTSGTGTRTNIGHGDPNEHQARGPERTSGTGTRTNKGCFYLGIEVVLVSSEQRSGTGTRTNIGHGDPNEHRARGPERTKGVFISESRLFWFQANSVRARGPERTSGTGTRTNIGHGDPNEHRARGPERTSSTGTRTNKGGRSGTGTRTNIEHGDPNEQRVFRSRNRGSFDFRCFIFSWVLIA